MSNRFFNRIKSDFHFRIKVFLRFSFIFNVGYAIFLLVVGKLISSNWFYVMALYNFLLFVARVFVFLQTSDKKTEKQKVKTMRFCGYFLFLINLAVSVMMFLLVNNSQGTRYHEIIVITIATYTFSSLSLAIINSVKHFKQNNHVYLCAKVISLISASVSMVTLTSTMLATWGKDNMALRNVILPILCGVVALFIISCAIFMIVKANLDLRTLDYEKERK